MDTFTLSSSRTTFRFLSLPTEFVERVRRTGRDDLGNVVQRFRSSGGGEPCRCVLRRALPGEDVILCSYRPFATETLFAEMGPIYLLAEPTLPQAKAFSSPPDGYFKENFVLRAYSVQEETVTASLVGWQNYASTLASMFDNPRVAFVHARFAAYGCFGCRIERQAAA